MHFKEKQIFIENLHYDKSKQMFLIDLSSICDFYYDKEGRSFLKKILKKRIKTIYYHKARHVLNRLMNEWNFSNSLNSHEFPEFETTNFLQTILKIKVFYGENASFKEVLRFTGAVEIFNRLCERLRLEVSAAKREELEKKALLLFSRALNKRSLQTSQWKKLKEKEKIKWIALSSLFQTQEFKKTANYYNLAKEFYQFEKKIIKNYSCSPEELAMKSDLASTICFGKELLNFIKEERKKEEEILNIFNTRRIEDSEKKDFIFTSDNPFYDSNYLENLHLSEPPLVWNIVETDPKKGLIYLSVNRDFKEAVIRYNKINFSLFIKAVERIMLEESGDKKQSQEFIQSHSFSKEKEGRCLLLKEYLEGERVLNLPRNYPDILRVQIQQFLKQAA